MTSKVVARRVSRPKYGYAGRCKRCKRKITDPSHKEGFCPGCGSPVVLFALCDKNWCNSCGLSAQLNDDCRANW
jgi:rRNA maturation endonuclease Nob1